MSYRDSQKLDKQLTQMPKPKLSKERRSLIQTAIENYEVKKTPRFPFFKTMGAMVAVGIFALLFITNLPNQDTPPNTSPIIENYSAFSVPENVSFIEVIKDEKTTGTSDDKVILSFFETIGKMEFKQTTKEGIKEGSTNSLTLNLYADINSSELLHSLTFYGKGIVSVNGHYYEIDQSVVDQFTNDYFKIIDEMASEEDPKNDPSIKWQDVERNQEELDAEQKEVDQGHQPGKLDPQDTAFTFVSQEFGEKGDIQVIQQKMSESLNSSEVYFEILVDQTKFHLLLDQPVKLGEAGIWSVFKYSIEQNGEQDSNKPTQEESIEEVAEQTLQVLADRNMQELSSIVHSKKGLTFSPYVNIKDDAEIFQKNEVLSLLDRTEKFEWGIYDGSGMPMELTPREYWNQFVKADQLIEYDEKNINEMKQRGNTYNNIKEAFPNSFYVEFYDKGTEANNFMDWQSLYLVYQKEDGEWKLIAVVHDQWTI
ncbi:hypothetical protein RZN25_03950 [Bacillaceae bacterium S4-13-56]